MNRGFLYGDGFFETIRIVNGQMPLLSNHIDRIEDGLDIYQMTPSFEINEVFIQGIAESYGDDGILRINFFRDGSGKYLPDSDTVAFDHSFTEETRAFFLPISLDLLAELDKAPHQPGSFSIYPEPKPNVSWLTVKSLSSIYYVLAAKYKKDQNIDYLFIQNGKGEICEELISNILISKGENIIIPNKSSGGINGATQRFILDNYGFQMMERIVTIKDIETADAVYSCKGSTGIVRIK
jgi:branched-chain amino acid aminotransferase